MPVWAVQVVLITTIFIKASYCDIKTRQVPDRYSLYLVLLALCTSSCRNWWGIFCALPFLVAGICIGGIGGADIKIMGAAGMVIGFFSGITVMIIGISCMLLFHMINKWICRKYIQSQAYPLVPFLTVGILIVYMIQKP